MDVRKQLETTLEVLCRGIAPSHWKSLNLAVLHAYFDAAGHESDQTHVVVAGFVSSASDWLSFEAAWRARLEQDDLKYFRAEDCAHFRGPFSEWSREKDEPRRRRLLNDLMCIVKSNVYRKFGSGVSMASLARDKASSDTFQRWRINAYVLGGRTSVADVGRWYVEEKIQSPIGFVFEDGDIGQGALSDLLHTHGYPRPSFEFKTDRLTPLGLRKGLVQLQAADWLAYEMFQATKRLFLRTPTDTNFRWAWNQFDRIPGVPGFYSPKDLMHLQGGIESYEAGRLDVKGDVSARDVSVSSVD